MIFPSLVNLNLRVESGSIQTSQVSHVLGQAAETPGYEQRILVDLFATHEQDLAIRFPSFRNLILSWESLHWIGVIDGISDSDAVGAPVSADVGNTLGFPVGNFDGDVVGSLGSAPDGDSLGIRVGDSVGVSVGAGEDDFVGALA